MLRIGMLTSGGDCQALNATMRGIAKALYTMYDTEVEIIGGQVHITVSEFSTYGFYIYLAQEHTAFDPVYPPWSEDDDYVPFPPIVVEEGEDNSVEVVACAAAAVVAALMAAFLIIDRRKG